MSHVYRIRTRHPSHNGKNASIMEHTARALAQMQRHGIKDTDDRAKLANQKFLASIPSKMAQHYPYFENLLKNLRQDLTEANYRTLLADLLKHFLETANI